MILANWLKRIRRGSGFCGFSASSWDRVCNVLETIEGIGCTINKTHSGNGWSIVVDGKSSDTPYPEGLTPYDGSNSSGLWWELAGDAATCFGYAIGNALAEKVIDLVEQTLVGDWGVDGDLLVEGKATMTDGVANIVANPSLMDSDNQMQPRQVTVYIPDGAGGLAPKKVWILCSSGVSGGDTITIPTVPSPDGLPDGRWIWGRVAYDATHNKFVQYKMVWSAATRTFTESETAEDIIALDSHASQHI